MVPELRDLILTKAAGNPLFMEELTHTLLENGTIEKKENRYLLRRSPSDIEIPDTVQGIIAARMDRLEESLKRIMQVASVIGREFAFRLLQSITEMKEDLKSHLLNLQGLEFIYEKRLFPELEYIFKHALTQEVAYNSLLLKRRQEIHQKAGRAIEQIYSDRLEECYEMLAYHYSRGEDFEKAARYLTLSGDKAARRHALRESHGFYKEALDALRRLPDTEERKKEMLDVLVQAAVPLNLLGFPEGSLAMLEAGEALSRELRDDRRLAFFNSRLSLYYTYRGDALQGERYSEDAFQEGRRSEDVDLIVPAAYGLCLSYMAKGQFDKLVAVARDALNLLERRRREVDFFGVPTNPYATLHAYCGVGLGYMGSFEEAELLLEKGFHHATRIGDVRTLAGVETFYGFVLSFRGFWRAAVEHLGKSITYGEEVKYLSGLSLSLALVGFAHTYLGDPEAGRSYGEKGLATHRQSGIEWSLCTQYYYLGSTYLELGDIEKAQTLAEEGLRLAQKNNEVCNEASAWLYLGRIIGHTHAIHMLKAEKCILRGMEIAGELKVAPSYARGHFYLGELHARSGQKEKALDNLTKAEAMFQEMGMDYWLAETRKVLAGL